MDEQLSPERQMDVVLSEIRAYAHKHSLNAEQVGELLEIGIMARAMITHDYEVENTTPVVLGSSRYDP